MTPKTQYLISAFGGILGGLVLALIVHASRHEYHDEPRHVLDPRPEEAV